MNTKNKINNFIKNRYSFYLFLPGGAYGRPCDNRYFIKEIRKSDTELILILGDDIHLHFFGDLALQEKEHEFSISKFKKFYFKINGRVKKFTIMERYFLAIFNSYLPLLINFLYK